MISIHALLKDLIYSLINMCLNQIKLETSGGSIIDSGTHAVTDFVFRLFKKTRWWTEPKMEFIKLFFMDHTHHKDSLDSREEKTKNLKFKLFVESKHKNRLSQILISHWSDDFGFWKFWLWKIWLWKPLYLNIFLCVINYFVTTKLNSSLQSRVIPLLKNSSM